MKFEVGQILYLVKDDTAELTEICIENLRKDLHDRWLITFKNSSVEYLLDYIPFNPTMKKYGLSFFKMRYRNSEKYCSIFTDKKLAVKTLVKCVIPARIREEHESARNLIDLYNDKIASINKLEEKIKEEKKKLKSLNEI